MMNIIKNQTFRILKIDFISGKLDDIFQIQIINTPKVYIEK